MWKNKHLVISMLVAPVLAIVAYFATDYVVSETPHAARAGDSYPLMARSNCRYASGQCDLVNGDVELMLRGEASGAGGVQLVLASVLPLQTVSIAIASSAADNALPSVLQPDNSPATRWRLSVDAAPDSESLLRVVVTAGDSHYFAEVPAVFLEEQAQGSR